MGHGVPPEISEFELAMQQEITHAEAIINNLYEEIKPSCGCEHHHNCAVAGLVGSMASILIFHIAQREDSQAGTNAGKVMQAYITEAVADLACRQPERDKMN